jgi:hypothetical protein
MLVNASSGNILHVILTGVVTAVVITAVANVLVNWAPVFDYSQWWYVPLNVLVATVVGWYLLDANNNSVPLMVLGWVVASGLLSLLLVVQEPPRARTNPVTGR